MREFIKIGDYRLELKRIVSYEVDNFNHGIRIYYDSEFNDLNGWMKIWFKDKNDMNITISKLDEIFIKK